jgi:large subunit ribosomal protein L21
LCGGVGVNGIYGLIVLENDMYAVIRSGGKQHRVKEGDTLKVEKLELETGSKFNFDEVLLVGEAEKLNIGAPLVKGSKVTGEVVSHGRAKKINILKFKRRKHHMKKMGHRQWFTEVKITGIKVTAPKKAAVKTEKAEIEE